MKSKMRKNKNLSIFLQWRNAKGSYLLGCSPSLFSHIYLCPTVIAHGRNLLQNGICWQNSLIVIGMCMVFGPRQGFGGITFCFILIYTCTQ